MALYGVMFCQHRPFHDERAVLVGHEIFKDAGIDRLWYGGDVLDLGTVSRWPNADDYSHEVQEEFDDLARYWEFVRKKHPDLDEIVLQDGNHEDRLPHYLRRNAQKLRSLRSLRLENLARLDDFGIRHVHGVATLAGGQFLLKHGTRTGEYAGRAELQREGRSGMCSHNHRLRVWSESSRDRKPLFWYHGGCLMKLPPAYVDDDSWYNWQQGVNLLRIDGRNWAVEQIPIYEGVAYWRGTRYSAA